MDPVEIVKLFANPYTAIVAVLAAAVEEAPDEWLHDSVRGCIGWLCVLACAPVAAGFGAEVAPAMFGGFLGLGGSWLLVEAVRARRGRRVIGSRPHKETNMDHEYAPEHEHETENPRRPPTPKPGHDDDTPDTENDGPPPHPPPPPPDLK